jgi:hypothetical protein
MAVKMVIKWGYKLDDATVAAIRKRFKIPTYTTLNGFSPVEIAEEDMEMFEETARRGFFTIFRKKWCKNGAQFSF